MRQQAPDIVEFYKILYVIKWIEFSTKPEKSMKLIKIALSLILLGLLVVSADWGDITESLASADLQIISAVLLILTAQFPISAYKWGKSLEIHGLFYSFAFLQKVLCVAFFFNNFLPTSIGGDAYRVVKTLPSTGHRSRPISAVLLERLIGFSVLLFLGFAFAVGSYGLYHTLLVEIFVIVGSIGSAIGSAGLYLYLKGTITSYVEKALAHNKLAALFENIRLILGQRRLLLAVIAVSVTFQLLAILSVYLLFRAFGVVASFPSCAIIASLSGVVAVLPISINGIGVTEGAFVYVATQLGLDLNQSIVVAFTLRVLNLPLSLVCGLIYFVDSSLFVSPSASMSRKLKEEIGNPR